MMQTFTYPALFEPGDDAGVIVVSFPDVPEAITEGEGRADASRMAADALGTALLAYVRAGRALPRPGRAARGLVPIAVEPDVAAKLAVLLAFAEADISQREFGRRLGKDEREVRRILDPMHPTKIGALDAALRTLGRRLVVGVEKVPAEV
jgi:antitoxin HicB